jgi:hypothetical protein
MGAKKLTAEERAALEARDRRLQRGLIAQDRALTKEAFEVIRLYLAKLAKKKAQWMLRAGVWDDVCQSVYGVILRWQGEGGANLREDESLWFLTLRVVKQVSKGFAKDLRWARLSFALDEPPATVKEQAAVEDALSRTSLAEGRRSRPEKEAANRELVEWIGWAVEKLSDDDQRVLAGLQEVAEGNVDSLGEALGIEPGAGRVRKRRLMERLGRLAIAEGNQEMARRLAGRKYADALELLYVAEPGADHRIEELELLRDGELPTGQKIELEKHVAECTGCRRTLRTLEIVAEALAVLALFPAPAFDIDSLFRKPASRAPKVAGVVAAVALAALGLAWALWPAPPPPPPLPPLRWLPPDEPRVVRKHAKEEDLMAPMAPEEPDAGPRKGKKH